MALAGIILNVLEKPSGGPTVNYSWISKAKCTGMNKHMAWLLAALWLWRKA